MLSRASICRFLTTDEPNSSLVCCMPAFTASERVIRHPGGHSIRGLCPLRVQKFHIPGLGCSHNLPVFIRFTLVFGLHICGYAETAGKTRKLGSRRQRSLAELPGVAARQAPYWLC